MVQSSPKWWKTPWEKEKLLVTSNFSFSRSVFKRFVWQKRKKTGFVWERVKAIDDDDDDDDNSDAVGSNDDNVDDDDN